MSHTGVSAWNFSVKQKNSFAIHLQITCVKQEILRVLYKITHTNTAMEKYNMQNSKKNSEMTISVLYKNKMQNFELYLDDAYFTLSRNINSWESKSEFQSSGTFDPWIWEHYVASKCRDQITLTQQHIPREENHQVNQHKTSWTHKITYFDITKIPTQFVKLWPSKVQWLQAKSQGQHFPKI